MRTLVLGLLAGLIATAASAQAQFGNTLGTPSTAARSAMDLDEVGVILTRLGFSASKVSNEQGESALRSVSSSGTVFVALPRSCGDRIAATGCQVFELFAVFTNLNVSLPQINEFHKSTAFTSTVVGLPNSRSIIFTKVFLGGGVTDSHFEFLISRFLLDTDNYITGSAGYTGTPARPVRFEAAFPPLFTQREVQTQVATELDTMSTFAINRIPDDGEDMPVFSTTQSLDVLKTFSPR